ncbi:MAG: hypothetical protein NVSMB52_00730 [Chloroflexota bacterium]
MRRVRPQRSGFIDLELITIGDYIVLAAAILTGISLFLPWVSLSQPRTHSEWAFTYSEIAAVVVIVFFLASVFLILYPAVASAFGVPPLPFATPLLFLAMGSLLLLIFTFQLGKYDCSIQCVGASRSIGVWVAWVASVFFIIGSIIKWGSRTTVRH